jgi:hypothetical protein
VLTKKTANDASSTNGGSSGPVPVSNGTAIGPAALFGRALEEWPSLLALATTHKLLRPTLSPLELAVAMAPIDWKTRVACDPSGSTP